MISFSETGEAPPAELLELCVEIVMVKRTARTHCRLPRASRMWWRNSARPISVRRCATRSANGSRRPRNSNSRRWRNTRRIAAPAPTILVEHDITYDLYAQLLALEEDWDLRRQLKRWRNFETAAWKRMARVVTMSEKDCAVVSGSACCRAAQRCGSRAVLSFRPRSGAAAATVHRIVRTSAQFAGRRILSGPGVAAASRCASSTSLPARATNSFSTATATASRSPLDRPGIELEGFVADVRPAYDRAAVVIAPLVASAGTNIKILEAMAMGKAIVSTPAGVNGLDLSPGEDFLLAPNAPAMADEIERLLAEPERRNRIGAAARNRVEREFGWDQIARRQGELYRELMI